MGNVLRVTCIAFQKYKVQAAVFLSASAHGHAYVMFICDIVGKTTQNNGKGHVFHIKFH
jgi:hypothetical protein